MATATRSIRITGYAASEMDLGEQNAEPGDDTYPLFAQWTGTSLVLFDASHADRLANIACSLANAIDTDIEAGRFNDCADTKRHNRAICRGLWNAAEKMRAAFARGGGSTLYQGSEPSFWD